MCNEGRKLIIEQEEQQIRAPSFTSITKVKNPKLEFVLLNFILSRIYEFYTTLSLQCS